MDKTDTLPEKKSGIGTLAVDGVIYGIMGGLAMFFSLAALALLSGEALRVILERFSGGGITSPILGLTGHLGVSAIYGALFGVLIWPVLTRLTSKKIGGWIGGIIYGGFLLLLAQIAILPGTNSPLSLFPFWEWALGHVMYGLVLGGLFARKFD
jgi:hypothetical protein